MGRCCQKNLKAIYKLFHSDTSLLTAHTKQHQPFFPSLKSINKASSPIRETKRGAASQLIWRIYCHESLFTSQIPLKL